MTEKIPTIEELEARIAFLKEEIRILRGFITVLRRRKATGLNQLALPTQEEKTSA